MNLCNITTCNSPSFLCLFMLFRIKGMNLVSFEVYDLIHFLTALSFGEFICGVTIRFRILKIDISKIFIYVLISA